MPTLEYPKSTEPRDLIAYAKEYNRKIFAPTAEEILEKQQEQIRLQALTDQNDRKYQQEKQRIQHLIDTTIKVGFWQIENAFDPGGSDEAISCIVPGWNQTQEAKACVLYMQAGIPEIRYRGSAMNRIKLASGVREALGSTDYVGPDRKYMYPEAWWVYIEQHSVKPTDSKFIQNALNWYNSKNKKEVL